MTYLVTGAGGFLGRAIVRALLARGRDVLAADLVAPTDLPPGTAAGAHLETIAYDVTSDVRPPGLDRPYDAIIHAAALTPGPDEEATIRDRLMRVNVGGTEQVLDLAFATGTRTFIHVSSSGVYRRGIAGALAESDADGGDSLYGASKLAAERLVRDVRGPRGYAVILRPCSLYGSGEAVRPSRPVTSPVWQLAMAAARGESVTLVRPSSRREWLSVHDAAAAVAIAAMGPAGSGSHVFNLGTGILDDLATLARLIGVRVVPEGGDRIVDGGEDWAGRLDAGAIAGTLGWRPQISLADGLARYVAELREGSM